MPAEEFTQRCYVAVERAASLAAQRGQYPIGSLHLLAGLLADEDSIASTVLRDLGVNLLALSQATMNALDWEPAEARGERGWSLAVNATKRSALEAASTRYAGTEHVLIGLLDQQSCAAARLLNDFGARRDAVIEKVKELIGG